MPKTITRAIHTNYGDNGHHFFDLGIDPIELESGTFNGCGWHILEVPGHGFVANFYPDEWANDFYSVEGYFDDAEAAKDSLLTLLSEADQHKVLWRGKDHEALHGGPFTEPAVAEFKAHGRLIDVQRTLKGLVLCCGPATLEGYLPTMETARKAASEFARALSTNCRSTTFYVFVPRV